MRENLLDRMLGDAQTRLAAGDEYRRVLEHIALTGLTPNEPNWNGLGAGDAERFVRMARTALATHPSR